MATGSDFPTSLDTFVDKIDNVDEVLAVETNKQSSAIEQLETIVGVTGSTDPNSLVYKINNISTSGMTNPMSASGDIIYGGTGGTPTRLAKGNDGQILSLTSGVPDWIDNSGVGDADSIGITIDGGGSAITTGSKGYREIPYNCTITGWTILAKESGSCVIDIKKCTYSGFPTTSTIAGTEKPTLSSAQKNQDNTLTSFTTSLTAGDILEFVVDSASTITRVHVFINITRS